MEEQDFHSIADKQAKRGTFDVLTTPLAGQHSLLRADDA
jgi:hypothetical protein